MLQGTDMVTLVNQWHPREGTGLIEPFESRWTPPVIVISAISLGAALPAAWRLLRPAIRIAKLYRLLRPGSNSELQRALRRYDLEWEQDSP